MEHISYIITSKLIAKPSHSHRQSPPKPRVKRPTTKQRHIKGWWVPNIPIPCHMTCNLCMGVCMSLAYSSEVEVLIGDNIDYIMKKFASEISN